MKARASKVLVPAAVKLEARTGIMGSAGATSGQATMPMATAPKAIVAAILSLVDHGSSIASAPYVARLIG
jgi:hypothetical protein